MEVDWRTSVWKQFGAAIDMLDEAIRLCPDHLWDTMVWKDTEDVRYGQFWFIASHTLMWLDRFQTGTPGTLQAFTPPAPFIRGTLPEQPYTKNQVLDYLSACRSKCQSTIETMTDERAQQRCVFEWMEPTFLELQLYCMRHVQEHAAQLGLVLGQHDISGVDWIANAKTISA